MAWIILLFAGVLEIGWAVGLKYTQGFSRLWPTLATAAALVGSMGLLGLALRTLPLGTAYAVWTGIGTVGTAVLGMILFREPATVARLVCIALILTGILGLRFVSAEQPAASRASQDEERTDAMHHGSGDGPVILVTGSTDGLGREVARRLAAQGAHVIVHGRNRERGESLVREIAESGTGSAAFFAADFASLDEARRFAQIIRAEYDRIDVLVNNAGIWLTQGERQTSADGHEMHFAVNYLAGYLLTHLLLDRIVESAPSRIVNLASGAQRPLDFDDPMLTREYSGFAAYAQSKLAQVMFTIDLARQLEASNVTVVALHPATLMDTPMVREAGVRPRSTVAEGADAVMRLITAPDVRSGQYYEGMESARAHGQAYDEGARARLRELSVSLTGEPRRANR
ncbi:MAG TPA: SDR family NAD(P)-dependent oxidoreductase [Longimicrobiales bacterium]|nr:SDR family NAD(P)-dependent oxidoreductase [Longimicrobiales bacterium]